MFQISGCQTAQAHGLQDCVIHVLVNTDYYLVNISIECSRLPVAIVNLCSSMYCLEDKRYLLPPDGHKSVYMYAGCMNQANDVTHRLAERGRSTRPNDDRPPSAVEACCNTRSSHGATLPACVCSAFHCLSVVPSVPICLSVCLPLLCTYHYPSVTLSLRFKILFYGNSSDLFVSIFCCLSKPVSFPLYFQFAPTCLLFSYP